MNIFTNRQLSVQDHLLRATMTILYACARQAELLPSQRGKSRAGSFQCRGFSTLVLQSCSASNIYMRYEPQNKLTHANTKGNKRHLAHGTQPRSSLEIKVKGNDNDQIQDKKDR